MRKTQVPIVCAVIADSEGRIFLQQRNDPGTWMDGLWEFPGGKIEFGEDLVSAVKRETKEESGYDVEVVRLLPTIYENVLENVDNTDWHVILICYECRIVGGEYKLSVESSAGKFFKRNEIDYSKCLKYTKEIIELLDK